MTARLNLLPWSCQRRTVYRECMFFWFATLTIELAFLGVWLSSGYARLSHLNLRLASAESANRDARELDRTNAELRKRLELSDERQVMLEQLDSVQRPLLLMGIVSDCSKLADGAIQVRHFASSQREIRPQVTPSKRPRRKRPGPPPEKQPVPTETLLSLEGIAGDDITLSRFMTGLRATGIFRNVELLSSSDITLLSGSARQFSVECTL